MSQDDLIAREALDLRLRLEFGLASLAEVELWADAWLFAFENPPDELTDLAMARRLTFNDAFTLLNRLNPTEPRPQDVPVAAASALPGELAPAQLRDLISHLESYARPFDRPDRDPAHAVLLKSIEVGDALLHAKDGHLITPEQASDRACICLTDAQAFTSSLRPAS